jgi:sugar O-acyltransferase (sialic acid O-acetyltransferase NeuD family)
MTDITSDTCLVIGAGGHARVLLDILRSSDPPVECALLDADPKRWGTTMMDVPIIGGDDMLPKLVQKGVRYFVIGLASTGGSTLRSSLFERAIALGLKPLPVIHVRAVRSPWSEVGCGLQMFAGSVINAGAVLGTSVIVNTGAIVEHDCRIEDHVHIATGARLCGCVKVGKGAHIGAAAVVRQGIGIGEGALVGAGSVVVRDVAPHTRVAGSPAKVLETLNKGQEA